MSVSSRGIPLRSGLMRAIDQGVGVPVCLLLVAWHVIWSPVRWLLKKLPRAGGPPVLAVMKFLGMGSIVLSAPAVRQLRSQIPDARVVFITFAANRRIVELLKIADTTLSIRTESFFGFAWDTLKTIVALRRMKARVVLDLEFFSKYSVIISYLSGADVRVGFYLREAWRKMLLTNHAFYNQYRHAQDNFGMLLRALSLRFDPVPVVRLEPERASKGDFEQRRRRPVTIAVNPNASDVIKLPMRRWGGDNFIVLGRRLLETYDCELWFLGSRGERAYVEDIVEVLRTGTADPHRVRNWAGETTIDELVALLQASDLLVTNDSGTMHIAAAAGTPVFAVFGAETPVVYAPLGSENVLFSQTTLYCHPCLHVYNRKDSTCTNPERYACLSRTTAEEVFSAIARRLEGKGAAGKEGARAV